MIGAVRGGQGFRLRTPVSVRAEGLLSLARVGIIVGSLDLLGNLCLVDEDMETCGGKGRWPRSHSS